MRALEVCEELTLVALGPPEDETVVADPEALDVHDRPTLPVPAPAYESGDRKSVV